MNAYEAEGVQSLVAMAVIATMRKFGVLSIHLSRHELAQAGTLDAEITQGPLDGIRIKVPDGFPPGPGTPSDKPHFEPVFQVRPGRDASWQDCTEQRYAIVGELMQHQAEKPQAQQFLWDRRTLYRRIEAPHTQD
jgi:hypothetical protein